jgi:hypothetical protein
MGFVFAVAVRTQWFCVAKTIRFYDHIDNILRLSTILSSSFGITLGILEKTQCGYVYSFLLHEVASLS